VADGLPAAAHEPVVSSGVVLAGYTVFSSPPVGGVMAWDAADGRLRWRRLLEALDGSSHTNGWGGGLGSAGGLAFATGRDGTLRALSVLDGSTVWQVPAEGTGCPAEPGRPELRPLTVTRHLLVAGSSSGCVAAVDAEARRARWRFADVRLGSTASRLASDGQLVYIPFLSGRLVALDRDRGVERWRLGDRDREFIWAPALAGRRVYLTSSSGYSGYVR
jgi:glucose dehydrogenase